MRGRAPGAVVSRLEVEAAIALVSESILAFDEMRATTVSNSEDGLEVRVPELRGSVCSGGSGAIFRGSQVRCGGLRDRIARPGYDGCRRGVARDSLCFLP